MKSLVLPSLFCLTLVDLLLLGQCIGASADSGTAQKQTQNEEVIPTTAYEAAQKIVGLALSRCWMELGENPAWSGGQRTLTWTVTTESYLRCTVKNIQQIKVYKVESDASGIPK